MSKPPRPEVREMLHRLRFQRLITIRDMPPIERGYCRWCGQKCFGRRYAWCSEECKTEFGVRAFADLASSYVYRRDAGICAECGIDCAELARIFRLAAYTYRRDKHGIQSLGPYMSPERLAQWGPWFRAGNSHPTLWDADHIIPVVEGGGVCGLANLRTLCLICHKRDTARLVAARARRGKWNESSRYARRGIA